MTHIQSFSFFIFFLIFLIRSLSLDCMLCCIWAKSDNSLTILPHSFFSRWQLQTQSLKRTVNNDDDHNIKHKWDRSIANRRPIGQRWSMMMTIEQIRYIFFFGSLLHKWIDLLLSDDHLLWINSEFSIIGQVKCNIYSLQARHWIFISFLHRPFACLRYKFIDVIWDSIMPTLAIVLMLLKKLKKNGKIELKCPSIY